MVSSATKVPVIGLYGSLIVPIQRALSDESVRQLKSDLTDAVERTGARGLIMDMSGVDVMDSYLTGVIRNLSVSVELMGVKTILCGLSPMIVMTLIEMDLQLGEVTTALNLETALGVMACELDEDSEDLAASAEGEVGQVDSEMPRPSLPPGVASD